MFTCKINNIEYNATIKRTYIEFNSDNDDIKLSYFDINKSKIRNNTLVIEIFYLPTIFITSNNIIKIYNNISKAIYNLQIEFKIDELLTDKIPDPEWVCNICLENNHNKLIELRCCKNILHKSCFYTFLQKNKLFNCPLCRNNKCIVCLGKGC